MSTNQTQTFNDWVSEPVTLPKTKSTQSSEEKTALSLIKKAASHVPAYKDFLQKNAINSQQINQITNLQDIPPTTKENYIDQYPLSQRSWNNALYRVTAISTSSGTSGHPHFWPRSLNNDLDGAIMHEIVFRHIFQADQIPTLCINAFALGNWIAGMYTSAALNLLILKDYPLTIVSPGYDLDEVIKVITHIAPQFQQTILFGHVPFLKEIIQSCLDQHLDIRTLNLKLIGSGQGITENWRNYMLESLGSQTLSDVTNFYGSAEAALMGFETPTTIEFRRSLELDLTKAQQLFNETRIPSIYAYHPHIIQFSEHNQELHFTKNSPSPFLNYNLQDHGGTITPQYFSQINAHVTKSNPLDHLPLVYLYGREKFMVKVYGANIYVEHAQQAFNHPLIQPHITGRFFMEMTYEQSNEPSLTCHIELHKTFTQPTAEFQQSVQNIFVEEIIKINSEYKYVYLKLGEKVKPKINLIPYGNEQYFSKTKVKKTS